MNFRGVERLQYGFLADVVVIVDVWDWVMLLLRSGRS